MTPRSWLKSYVEVYDNEWRKGRHRNEFKDKIEFISFTCQMTK